MNRYKYLYLVWLIPASFLFLILHQASVYYGIADTYKNGTSYTAEVVDFEIKQIAAQTNGFIVLRFDTRTSEKVQRKLSLPVEMAGELQGTRIIPVRYQADAFQEIVIMQTFKIQKGLVLTNIAMAFVGLVFTIFIAIFAHRFANKKLRAGHEEMHFERLD